MTRLASAVLAVVGLAAATAARAVPVVLPPDPPYPYEDVLDLPGTSRAAEPHLQGTVLEDETTAINYHYSPPGSLSGDYYTVTGWLQSRVVRSHVDQTIDFHWRFLLNVERNATWLDHDRSPYAAEAVSLRNAYDPRFSYDANWLTDEGGTPLDQLTVIGNMGDQHWLGYGDMRLDAIPHQGNGPSAWFVLDTDARAYARTARLTVDSENLFRQSYPAGGGDTAYTFAPAIPEPETWALTGLGLAVVGWFASRRQRSRVNPT